jgi:hypothetical protein
MGNAGWISGYCMPHIFHVWTEENDPHFDGVVIVPHLLIRYHEDD